MGNPATLRKFTTESARIAQKKSVEVQAQNRLRENQRKAEAARLAAEVAQAAPAILAPELLARVRDTIDRLLSEVDKEALSPHCKRLDRLTSAVCRLLEQERILAGRPLPPRAKDHGPEKRDGPGKRESEIAEPLPEKSDASQPAPSAVSGSLAPDATSQG